MDRVNKRRKQIRWLRHDFDFSSVEIEDTSDVRKPKSHRLIFKEMGLNVRALQNARILEHDTDCLRPTGDDINATLRSLLDDRNFDI